MRNILKNSWMFIFILFVTLFLPFRVEAKQTNTFIDENYFDGEELISGDTIRFGKAITYIPVENQNFEFYVLDKVIKFEYYVIDSVDSNGNIKYKKYDFSNLDKSAWYPDSSNVFNTSGRYYSNVKITADTVDFYNLCNANRSNNYLFSTSDGGFCNIVLPSINGKISRWRFDSKDYGEKKSIDICKFINSSTGSTQYYSSCDETDEELTSIYIGTYEYYTSYTYKFYEIPEEQPKLKVMCDTNELKNGETTECKVSFSYKYDLSSIVFNITSDKLIIDDFQSNNGWNVDYTDDGVSLNYLSDRLTNAFVDDTEIATFKIVADDNVDDILASLTATDFRYIDKTGENNLDDFNLDIDLGKDKADEDNKNIKDFIGDIINPNTFRDNYYLIIGVIIIGGICLIQLRDKKKSK